MNPTPARRLYVCVVAILSTILCLQSQAASIQNVTVSGFSSQLVGSYFPLVQGVFNRPASATVDGLFTTAVDAFDFGPSGPLPGGRLWLTEGVGVPKGAAGTPTNDRAPFIKFDLGGKYKLDQITIFNENEATPSPQGFIPPPGHTYNQRGVRTADITIFDNGLATDLGIFTFAQAPGTAGFTPQNLNLALHPEATAVLITILSNYNGDTFGPGGVITSPDFGFVGLNEVQFSGTAVPLPSPSRAILCLALPALLIVRRRRAQAA